MITINEPQAGSTSTGSYIKIEADVEDPESELKRISIYVRDIQNITDTLVKTIQGNLGSTYALNYYYSPPVLSASYDFVIVAENEDPCGTGLTASEVVQDIDYTYQFGFFLPSVSLKGLCLFCNAIVLLYGFYVRS